MADLRRSLSGSNLPLTLGALSGLGLAAAIIGVIVGAMGWFWAGSIVFVVAGLTALVLGTRSSQAATTTRPPQAYARAERQAGAIAPPPPPATGTGIEISPDDRP